MGKLIDLTGQVFNRWTVIEFAFVKSKKTFWKCRCECGNVRYISSYSLRKGLSKSCGCYHSELMSKRPLAKTHGLYYKCPRLYRIWQNMKNRCCNKNVKKYKYYGARGIKVCEEWKYDFQVFYDWAMSNGYADDLSIDRIDVNGNYEPNNCRWVTMKEQSNNKRNNHLIRFNGKTRTLQEWSDELNIDKHLLISRIKLGWTMEEIIKIKPTPSNRISAIRERGVVYDN